MNLISIADLSRDDILRLLDSAEAFRARRGHHGQPLQGKSLAMIFEKPSTRTRVSLEVAAAELGCHPLYLSAGELQYLMRARGSPGEGLLHRQVPVLFGQGAVPEKLVKFDSFWKDYVARQGARDLDFDEPTVKVAF